MNTPKVSVIMGIYNCEDTVADAIESILSQTYSNLELIMCDDGSTDKTYDIAKSYKNKHSNIVLFKNPENLGLAYALNECLTFATGDLIARQDGDDISVQERIQKQVDCFSRNKEVSIISTSTIRFDENGVWGKVVDPAAPTKLDFITGSPFCHGPAMIKKEALLAVDGYDPTKKSWRAEDYDLWFRLYAAGFIGMNILEPLYWVRDDRNAFKRRKFRYRFIESHIKYRGFKSLGIPYKNYYHIARPILVGFVPKGLYKYLRRKRYS